MRSHLLLVACLLGACGRDTAVLALDVGRETGTLDADPRPSRWDIGFRAIEDLTRSSLGGGTWPSSSLDVSLEPERIGLFDVSFQDDTGRELAYGATPFVTVDQLPGRRLSVFVQRRGQWARPLPDLDGRGRPLLAIASERLLVVGGGTDTLAAFDLALGGVLAEQNISVVPESLVATPSALFAAAGARLVRFDLQTGTSADSNLPSDVAASELAGAPLIARGDAYAWVGPARSGVPSSAVLLATDDSVQTARLPEARADQVVAVLSDGALLLAGPSGAMRVAEGTVSEQPFPRFERPVALAVLEDGSQIVIDAAAGVRTAYRAAPGCDVTCTPAVLGASPCAAREQLLALGNEALLTCDDVEGRSRAFRLAAAPADSSAPNLEEVATREPRRGATLVRLGSAEAALVGGGPLSFERYRPR